MAGSASSKNDDRSPVRGEGASGYWVYMLCCADGTFYTGFARDVSRRLAEHNGERGRGARYTASRRPVRVIYQAPFPDRSSAQQEEARIKAMSRADKQRLALAVSCGKPR